jgi:hypothetical protein
MVYERFILLPRLFLLFFFSFGFRLLLIAALLFKREIRIDNRFAIYDASPRFAVNFAILLVFALLNCGLFVSVNGQTPASHPIAVPRDAKTLAEISVRNPDGQSLIQESLASLGTPDGAIATGSCAISGSITPMGKSSRSADWSVEASDYLEVMHGSAGDFRFGSRTTYTAAGKSFAPSDRMNRVHFIPAAATAWLARAFTLPTIVIGSVTKQTLSGRDVLVVPLWDSVNSAVRVASEQTWYFDATTHIPIRVDYKISFPEAIGGTMPAYALLGDFQSFQGIQFATNISTYISNKLSYQATVTAATCTAQRHPNSYFDGNAR